MAARRARLTFELLESRVNPVGNVIVKPIGSSLYVTGDTADNDVSISQTASNSFTITPRSGTTVNSGTAPVRIDNVMGDLVIRLGNGNDRIGLGAFGMTLRVGRDLILNGGNGDFELNAIGHLGVGRDLIVSHAIGDNRLTDFSTLTVGRDFRVSTGPGNSETGVLNSGPGVNSVGRNLSVINKLGSSSNIFNAMAVGGDVLFNSAARRDDNIFNYFDGGSEEGRQTIVGDFVVRARGGSAIINFIDTDTRGDVRMDLRPSTYWQAQIGKALLPGIPVIGGSISFFAPTGDYNQLRLGELNDVNGSGLTLLGDLSVNVGTGSETILLSGLTVGGDTSVKTGAGLDEVDIEDSIFRGSFELWTGTWNDVVKIERREGVDNLSSTQFWDDVYFNLGYGNDTLDLGRAGDQGTVVRILEMAIFDGSIGIDRRDAANVEEFGVKGRYVRFEQSGPASLFDNPL